MKKIISLVLTVLMIFSMSTVIFAEETTQLFSAIKITGTYVNNDPNAGKDAEKLDCLHVAGENAK